MVTSGLEHLLHPRRLLAALYLCIGAAGIGSLGCAGQKRDANLAVEGEHQLAPTHIEDAKFATAVHRLLREGARSPERSALLAGVVRRQLTHATESLAQGNHARSASSVVGAFYLLRIGEARVDMFDEQNIRALEGAVAHVSARGDEGRALALMLLLRRLLPDGPKRQQLDTHVAALRRWMKDTRTGGDMANLRAAERAAVGHSLLDPTRDSLDRAATAINKWIKRAVEYNLRYQQTRRLPPREEIAEAYRALQTGGETMAALYLRYGMAREALEVIESTAAGRVASPAFFGRLRAAARDDTAEDWRLLARDFARIAFSKGELPMDRELVDAALWGIALEAYRRDPTSLAVGHLLADQLIELGMPEVAPLVLRDALGVDPSTVSLNAVMAAVGNTLSEQFEAGSVAGARRVFASSQPLFALADRDAYAGQLEPSTAQLRQMMAGIELRSGNLLAARPLLATALQAEPTVWGYTMLGMLERQAGKLDDALAHATRAIELPAAKVLPLDVARAQLLAFEVMRDKGDNSGAAEALEIALELALSTRKRGTGETRVRAEQLLARVLDSYGERQSASRAITRALDIASKHRQVLSETVLSAVGRGLVQKDMNAARGALQIGIKATIDEHDLVYGALWLMFLEREDGGTPDGKVDRVLLESIHDDTWTGHLARWARNIIDDDALLKAATTYTHEVEAAFYISMRARIAGRAGADKQLAKVASNPLIELMEVQLARDILAPKSGAKMPHKYSLP